MRAFSSLALILFFLCILQQTVSFKPGSIGPRIHQIRGFGKSSAAFQGINNNDNNKHLLRRPVDLIEQSSTSSTRLYARAMGPARSALPAVSRGFNLKNLKTTTNLLILLNGLVFAAGFLDPKMLSFFKMHSRDVLEDNPLLYVGMLFSCIGHQQYMHLFTNMMSLYYLGPPTERIFGPSKTVMIYFFSSLLVNAFSYILVPEVTSLGASSSTMGMMGALGMYYMVNRNKLQESKYILDSIQRSLASTLMHGLMDRRINNFAHFVGFIVGGVLSTFMAPKVRSTRQAMSKSFQTYGR